MPMPRSNKRKLNEPNNTDAPSIKKSKQANSKASNTNTNNKKNETMNDLWKSPESAIKWLIKGAKTSSNKDISLNDFFFEYFGKKPLYISRNDKKYYSKEFLDITLKRIKLISDEFDLCHGIHIISKYCKNDIEDCPDWLLKKQNLNEKLESNEINKIFKDGCTIQFHHPQQKYYELMHFIYLLESYFKVLVGCNIYLTPNNTQGLAPHYDDVDVWILQIEGKKHWKLYSNGLKNNCMPVESSGDLNLKNEVPNAKLIMECDLVPGDLLYLPRGTIHCAEAIKENDGDFSNHLTISTHQRSTLAHFEQLVLRRSMDLVLNDSNILEQFAEHRNNIDTITLSQIGSGFKNNDGSAISNKIINTLIKSNDLQNLIKMVTKDSSDEIYIDFLQNRLPPIDKICYTEGLLFGNPKNKEMILEKTKENETNDTPLDIDKITNSTKIKLINRDYVRFVESMKHKDLISKNNNNDIIGANTNEVLMDNVLEFVTTGNNNNDNNDNNDNNIIEMKESPAIPSKKENKSKSKTESTKSVTKIISLKDENDDKNKLKIESSEEMEDIDINPLIINKNFEDEFCNDEMMNEDEEMNDPHLLLFHCFHNNPSIHMTEFIDDDYVKGPNATIAIFLKPLIDVLFETYPNMIKIETLLKKANKLETEAEIELSLNDVKELIEILHSEEIIQIDF